MNDGGFSLPNQGSGEQSVSPELERPGAAPEPPPKTGGELKENLAFEDEPVNRAISTAAGNEDLSQADLRPGAIEKSPSPIEVPKAKSDGGIARSSSQTAVSKVANSGAGSQSIDGLRFQDLPKIPASLANDLSRYTNFRWATIADWHPSKRDMIVITNVVGTTQVHQVAKPGGARFQLTFEEDNVLWFGATTNTASFDPLDGKFFIFSKDKGGSEANQTYRYDFDTGKITLLTDGKSRNTPGVWSNSRKLLAYESTRRTGRDTDLYIIDPREPSSDRLLSVVGGAGWKIMDWSPDDSRILVRKHRSINESYLWSFDTNSGQAELIMPKDGRIEISYQDAQFSRDGNALYVLTDKDSEYLRLAYLDIASGQHTYLSPRINWDVDRMKLSKDRSKIAYTTNENGVSVLHVMFLESGHILDFDSFGPGVISALEWHQNGVDLGFSFVSHKSPHDAFSVNIESGVVERWTFSETGGVNPDTFVEPELVQWKSPDGLEFSGYIYRPPAEKVSKRSPVIIYFHGGPEGQFKPGFMGRVNYYVNELGITMIFPNIRGSSGFGKTFLKLDDGMLRSNAYMDMKTVLDWSRSQNELDPDRVMLMGRSYGGYLALAGASYFSDSIRGAIDIVGPTNLVTLLKNTSGYRRMLRRAEYGDERGPIMRKYLEDIAPLNRADKIRKPLLVIQGANDPRVPESESRQMVKKINKLGVPVWYLVVEGAGHSFSKKPFIDTEFYTVVLFAKKYLLPEALPETKVGILESDNNNTY